MTAEASLVRVAELVREFHDLTAGTPLAGDAEVVCHNDLAPNNTVYSPDGAGLRPVAFIDWDLAAPGRRIHDVAHVCWQYLGLGPGAVVGAGRARDPADLRRVPARRPGRDRGCHHVVAGPVLARHPGRGRGR